MDPVFLEDVRKASVAQIVPLSSDTDMGFFSRRRKESASADWHNISTAEEVRQTLGSDGPLILFKHSRTCGVSMMARKQVMNLASEGITIHEVVVQDAREASNHVATETGIRHESPQAFVISQGRVQTALSHGAIQTDALRKALADSTSSSSIVSGGAKLILLAVLLGCGVDSTPMVSETSDTESIVSVQVDALDGSASLVIPNPTSALTVVNFWATWCGPCIEEIPDLMAVYDRFSRADVALYGLSHDLVGEEDRVITFARELGITYPIAIDGGSAAQALGGLRGLPATFVLNDEGTVVYRHWGVISDSLLSTTINKALAAAPKG